MLEARERMKIHGESRGWELVPSGGMPVWQFIPGGKFSPIPNKETA